MALVANRPLSPLAGLEELWAETLGDPRVQIQPGTSVAGLTAHNCGLVIPLGSTLPSGRRRQIGNTSHADGPQHRRSSAFLLAMAFFVLISGQARSQTPSTGALTGLVLDPSGAALRGAVVVLTSQETGATDSATSNGEGEFSFLLLLPGITK